MVKPGKTLDLGCGNGRNSLYLAANGYDVDAWDKNAMSIANVERIKSIENLDNLHTRVVDLNPCTVGFPFAFKEGELRRYYEGWERVKYNEDVGELHRTDANGNRIKLRFATMLARKK